MYKLVQWTKRLPFYLELPVEVHTTLLTHKWHEILVLTTSAYQAIHGQHKFSNVGSDVMGADFMQEVIMYTHTHPLTRTHTYIYIYIYIYFSFVRRFPNPSPIARFSLGARFSGRSTDKGTFTLTERTHRAGRFISPPRTDTIVCTCILRRSRVEPFCFERIMQAALFFTAGPYRINTILNRIVIGNVNLRPPPRTDMFLPDVSRFDEIQASHFLPFEHERIIGRFIRGKRELSTFG